MSYSETLGINGRIHLSHFHTCLCVWVWVSPYPRPCTVACRSLVSLDRNTAVTPEGVPSPCLCRLWETMQRLRQTLRALGIVGTVPSKHGQKREHALRHIYQLTERNKSVKREHALESVAYLPTSFCHNVLSPTLAEVLFRPWK